MSWGTSTSASIFTPSRATNSVASREEKAAASAGALGMGVPSSVLGGEYAVTVGDSTSLMMSVTVMAPMGRRAESTMYTRCTCTAQHNTAQVTAAEHTHTRTETQTDTDTLTSIRNTHTDTLAQTRTHTHTGISFTHTCAEARSSTTAVSVSVGVTVMGCAAFFTRLAAGLASASSASAADRPARLFTSDRLKLPTTPPSGSTSGRPNRPALMSASITSRAVEVVADADRMRSGSVGNSSPTGIVPKPPRTGRFSRRALITLVPVTMPSMWLSFSGLMIAMR